MVMKLGLTGRRVLVVEDDILVMMLIEDVLTSLGCVFEAASSVESAMSLLVHRFDAAVIDVHLAGRESYPIADALAARGIPFLFSTGHNEAGLRSDYRHYPILEKPYSEETLLQKLHSLIEGLPDTAWGPRKAMAQARPDESVSTSCMRLPRSASTSSAEMSRLQATRARARATGSCRSWPFGVTETRTRRSSRGARFLSTRPATSIRLRSGVSVPESSARRRPMSVTVDSPSSHRTSRTRYCG